MNPEINNLRTLADNMGTKLLPVMEKKELTEEFVRSVIFHEDDVQEVLDAIEEDSLEYIRHDLFVKLEEAGGDL